MRKTFLLLVLFFLLFSCSDDDFIGYEYDYTPFGVPSGIVELSFSVAADMRGYTGDNIHYFRGACERLFYGGPGSFMISPGDLDPPAQAYSTIKTYIDSEYIWYPIAGNHETETISDMEWLRNHNSNGNTLLNIENTGPAGSAETTYSFDYNNAHFIILNQYFNGISDTGSDGDVTDALHTWLVSDLELNTKPVVIVFGHEPAYPQPDKDSGRLRHGNDSLNQYPVNRDRFWNTLSTYGVKAYICGHTHNYSTYLKDNVLQIDAGHARGEGDNGAKSTFLMFYIMNDDSVWVYTYRFSGIEKNYMLTETIHID